MCVVFMCSSDLVACQHVHVSLMGNLDVIGGIPWLSETDGALCLTCREDHETLCHFFFDCPTFSPNFDSLWCNLHSKTSNFNATDGIQISQFITSLDRFHKTLFLLGCLHFDNTTDTSVNKFMSLQLQRYTHICRI